MVEIVIFAMLFSGILVKNGITDAKAYAAGRTPDRFQRSQTLIGLADKAIDRGGKKRTAKSAKKPGRARAYAGQCVDDAWNAAARRRQIRHEVKDPIRAERYRGKIEKREAKKQQRRRDRDLKRENKRLDRELNKTERDQVRDRYDRRSGDVHTPVEAYVPTNQSPDNQSPDSQSADDQSPDDQSPDDRDNPRQETAEDTAPETEGPEQDPMPRSEAPGDAAPQETNDGDADRAEPRETDAPPADAADGLAAGADSENSGGGPAAGETSSTTRPGKEATPMSEQMVYEGGLANAVAYCQQQAAKRGEDVASVQETITGLQAARYGEEVTGPLAEAEEALGTAVAAFGEAEKVLATYVGVQEAYESAPGAPDKDELLAHQ